MCCCNGVSQERIACCNKLICKLSFLVMIAAGIIVWLAYELADGKVIKFAGTLYKGPYDFTISDYLFALSIVLCIFLVLVSCCGMVATGVQSKCCLFLFSLFLLITILLYSTSGTALLLVSLYSEDYVLAGCQNNTMF